MIDTRTAGPPALEVRALDADGQGPLGLRIEPDEAGVYRIRLCGPDGVDAIQVTAFQDGTCRFCCELAAEPGQIVELAAIPLDDNRYRLEAGGRSLRVLSPAGTLPPEPAGVILPAPGGADAAAEADCQLALVLDTTSRVYLSDPGTPGDGPARASGQPALRGMPLLGHDLAWSRVRRFIDELVHGLANGLPSLRWHLIGFADDPIPGVKAEDLAQTRERRAALQTPAPTPTPGHLRPWCRDDDEDLDQALSRLMPGHGGDYVDALAEALAACVELDWTASRRILMIIGDSPGHSLLHPLPGPGSARMRCLDVDGQARRLHDRGVEVVSLYLTPPVAFVESLEPRPGQLLHEARQQYRRLASVPKYFRAIEALDPVHLGQQRAHGGAGDDVPPIPGAGDLVNDLIERRRPIGRGVSYGLAVDSAGA